jgi:hypothetical protein
LLHARATDSGEAELRAAIAVPGPATAMTSKAARARKRFTVPRL